MSFSPAGMIEVTPVTSDSEIVLIRQLFEEYFVSLGVALAWQNIDEEVDSLPGRYSPPRGSLFLVREQETIAGCVGLRPFSESVGEIKRLYVRPDFRGRGLGRLLISAAIRAARGIGYRALVLDSLNSMHPAISLYKSFGFERTEPYWQNPLDNVQYFRLSLEPVEPGKAGQ